MMASTSKNPEIDPTIMQNRLSTESKESSYMGFDRGIDSDIEMEMAPVRPLTPVNPGCRSAEMPPGGKPSSLGADPMTASRCSSEPHLKRRMILTPKLARWESMDPPEPNESQTLLGAEVKPVPICKSDSVMGIKRLELEEGRGAEITKQGVLTINGNEQKLQPANHKTADTASTDHQDNQNLRVASAPTTSVGSYTSFGTNSGGHHKTRVKLLKSHRSQNDSLIVMLSAIYAKLLVVVGICFPLAEVISRKIPISYYEGFYLYLYLGSIAFLLFVYVFLLKTDRSVKHGNKLKRALDGLKSRFLTKEPASSSEEANTQNSSSSTESLDQHASKKTADESYCCGNFYLRLGAVVFGIGSMIYSGLEFGQFFELEVGTPCYNILYGLTPTTRMAFTFVQMHFIFLNFKICIDKCVALARFGLMHLIATNLCVWLHVVVQETKHGILSLSNVSMSTSIKFASQNVISQVMDEESVATPLGKITNHSRLQQPLHDKELYVPHECRRSNIMGELVQEASHFLFPCSIQYSLICAAILYIMWKKISGNTCIIRNPDEYAGKPSVEATRHSQHYQVDCAKANKGLFTGILVLVLSIISIILFFVLIGKPEYKIVAIMEARITELVLYLLSSLAVAVALFQVRELKYNPYYNTELDSILLIVAQSGLYVYTLFSIIGAYFSQQQNILLVLLTSLVCIIQATLQTVFILDASRRYANTTSQVHRKPGREMVTFLLVCNFAMWVVNTLQTQQTDSNPIQLSFYGFWAWTVITHITTPLAIYFRFHSAVCLCDIWKRTYKMRREFI